MSKGTLLLISGGLEGMPAIRVARDMGLHVVVSDGNPQAPGLREADDALLVSTYDVEGTAQAAERYHREVRPIHGVLCVAADVPLTVSRVAQRLGLVGPHPETARLCMDKLAMKEHLLRHGIPVPWFQEVESLTQLRRLVQRRGYPLVLKPADSRGARGVLLLRPGVDLEWAYEEALRHSPSRRLLLEEYLEGPQVSTETLFVGEKAYTVGFSDRNYRELERFAPHMIEDGGELPSFLKAGQQQAIRRQAEEAARCLGVRNGVAKGDMVLCRGRAYVIEIAARLSGGYFCTHEIPLHTGVDFVRQAIRVALGEEPDQKDLAPLRRQAVAQRYFFPPPGRVVGIRGAEEVASRPGIALLEIRVRPGDRVPPIAAHPARAGVVIAVGRDRRQAMRRAQAAVRDVRIEIEPIPSPRQKLQKSLS